MRISDWSSDVCSSDLAARDIRDGGEQVGQAEPAGKSGLRGLLDDRAVHDGVAVRRSDLQHVRAVVGQRHGGLDAGAQVGESGGEVADECAAPFRTRRVDRGGDPRGHSSTPSPLAASSAGGTFTISACWESYSSKYRSEEHTSELQSLMRT